MSSDKEMQTEAPPNSPHPYPKRGKGKKPYKLTEDPEYMKQYALKYYREKRSAPVPCNNCGRMVCKAKIYRHVQTSICSRNTKDALEIEAIKEAHRQRLLSQA